MNFFLLKLNSNATREMLKKMESKTAEGRLEIVSKTSKSLKLNLNFSKSLFMSLSAKIILPKIIPINIRILESKACLCLSKKIVKINVTV